MISRFALTDVHIIVESQQTYEDFQMQCPIQMGVNANRGIKLHVYWKRVENHAAYTLIKYTSHTHNTAFLNSNAEYLLCRTGYLALYNAKSGRS